MGRKPKSFVLSGMKLLVCLVTLSVSLAAPLAPSRAQPAQRPGYELLTMAAGLVAPGEKGGAGGAEKLKRQRLNVEHNALALKLLRQALQLPISAPRGEGNREFLSLNLAKFRELSRQLLDESDVHLADGDLAGALDSRLTALDLGAAITRGAPQLDVLIGAAIEESARADFAPIAQKLDAPQLRSALGRLQATDARRASYVQTLEVEEAFATTQITARWRAFVAAETERKRQAKPESAPILDLTPAQIAETLALTPESLAAQIAAFFAALGAREALPYQRARQIEVAPAPGAFVGLVTDSYRDSLSRFQFERGLTAMRLFEAALELRAIKLESGAYPTQFDAPIDPFSDGKPLVYRLEAGKPLLYSIGPDGEDNGGEAIEFGAAPGQNSARSLFQTFAPQASGDVLAPIF